MTRDDIIRLAREAGDDWDHTLPNDRAFIERFAAIVAAAKQEVYAAGVAAEREACAKVCDSLHDKIELVEKTEHYPGEYGSEYDAGQGNAISECVDAIRARGEK